MLADAHAEWLGARGLDVEIATRYGLNSVERKLDGQPYGAIAIPYVRQTYTVNRKYRWLSHPNGLRWSQDKGGKQILWNEDVLRDSSLASTPVLITEGEWDALAAIQCGYVRTTSVPGGANASFDIDEQLTPHLRETRRILLCGDADAPGQALNAELARRLGAARCFRPEYPPGCKDVNDILVRYGPSVVQTVLETAQPYPVRGLYSLDHYANLPDLQLFETGFPNLNAHLKLWRGELMAITGVPGHGKSRFALELLASMNRLHGHKAVIASPEMPIVPQLRDVLREHFHGARNSELSTEHKREADEWIRENFYFIDQNPREETEDADINWIIDKAEDAVFRHGVSWFLLDPWNLVEHRRERFENETDYHGRALRSLKRFAKSYECGVVVVAHPTKSVQTISGDLRRPTLYDISGSAHWHNQCDHGVIVWATNPVNTVREVHVAKSRFHDAGVPGRAFLKLDGRLRATAEH